MPEPSEIQQAPARRSLWWLDLLLFLSLCAVSVPISMRYTHGDLWLDEADYAIAGLHSVQDNRWDVSDKPDQPDLLIRLRHFHAPATAYVVRFAHRFGSDEETLRFPFVIAGALAVGMVYLCGLALFADRREIAAGCALLTAISPANIRMASHAIPWAFIILELLVLLFVTLRFAQSRRPSCLIWVGLIVGLLFVTSETFFVAAAILAVAIPLILLPEIRRAINRAPSRRANAEPRRSIDESSDMIGGRALLRGAAGGTAAFLTVGLILWPAGLHGHCILMLKHYIEMRHSDAFAVNIGSQVYKTAPKWAYVYWYWNYYRPFMLCYAAGLAAVLAIVLSSLGGMLYAPPSVVERRDKSDWPVSPINPAVLLVFTAVLLAAAHRAHIIGPEYLAHCLPFLTLCAGFAVLVISKQSRIVGVLALAAAMVVFVRWKPSRLLPGMEPRTRIRRWQEAARTVAPRWEEKDRLLLGPQSSNVAYWYLHEWAHLPIHDWQIGQFSLAGPGPNFLHNLSMGKYRWVVISSEFEDNVIKAVDPRSMEILNTWEVALKSGEKRMGPSRLTVFRCPIQPPSARP